MYFVIHPGTICRRVVYEHKQKKSSGPIARSSQIHIICFCGYGFLKMQLIFAQAVCSHPERRPVSNCTWALHKGTNRPCFPFGFLSCVLTNLETHHFDGIRRKGNAVSSSAQNFGDPQRSLAQNVLINFSKTPDLVESVQPAVNYAWGIGGSCPHSTERLQCFALTLC